MNGKVANFFWRIKFLGQMFFVLFPRFNLNFLVCSLLRCVSNFNFLFVIYRLFIFNNFSLQIIDNLFEKKYFINILVNLFFYRKIVSSKSSSSALSFFKKMGKVSKFEIISNISERNVVNKRLINNKLNTKNLIKFVMSEFFFKNFGLLLPKLKYVLSTYD